MMDTRTGKERAIAIQLVQHYRRQCRKKISAAELHEYQKKIRALRVEHNL